MGYVAGVAGAVINACFEDFASVLRGSALSETFLRSVIKVTVLTKAVSTIVCTLMRAVQV
jgi:hypothetical protein